VSVPVRYAEQGFAGDGLQPTLRFGFQPRLKRGVDMTSAVKGGVPMFSTCALSQLRLSSAEPEPVRDDGCSCCYPWVGDHLTGGRRVPASLEARGVVAASSRHRG
jgi:hypothetical protein